MTARVDRPTAHGVLLNHEKRIAQLEALAVGKFKVVVLDKGAALTVGDDVGPPFMIPADLDGTTLQNPAAYVSVVSTSGQPTIQIRNLTTGFDMLSTPITIDPFAFNSYPAATPPVVDPLHEIVSVGDRIAVDVDATGTNAKGLGVILVFR